MGFLTRLSKVLSRIIPRDTERAAGYGIFKLPDGHWMHRAAGLHDDAFDYASQNDESLHEVDWMLFYRWVLQVNTNPNYEERCNMALEICRYWPLARYFGRFMWDGKQ